MKGFRLLCLLVIGICFLLPSVVYAAYDYYTPITVYNNDSSDWSGSVLVTLNHSQLVDLGYINSTALDTRLLEGSTDRLHMAADARLGLFIPSILGTQSRTYHYRLGEDPATITSFPVIVGDGGNVTVTDHANLELANNFSIEFEGWVDPLEDEELVFKWYAFGIATGSSNLVSWISESSTTGSTLKPVGVGDETNLTPSAGTNWGCVSDGSDSTFVHTSTSSYRRDFYSLADPSSSFSSWYTIANVVVYFRIYNSGFATTYAIPHFKTDGGVYNGTEQSQYGNTWSTKSETFTTSPATGEAWTWDEIKDMQLGISVKAGANIARCSRVDIAVNYYAPDAELIIPGLSSGEYTVNVWADATNFGIDIDGVTANSTALGGASVPDNANNWVISNLPYFNYYSHTVGATHRIQYEPTSYILGTVLPNSLSPGTYNGAITWGANPATIDVTVGGMEPFSSPVAPGTGEEGVCL